MEQYCTHCRRLEVFEQPECADHSSADCPDRVCVMCGTAVFTDIAFTGIAFTGMEIAPAPASARRTA